MIEVLIAVVVILSIIAFALYVAALFGTPTGRRPRTPTMDRLGHELPPSPNPGYRETEDEKHR